MMSWISVVSYLGYIYIKRKRAQAENSIDVQSMGLLLFSWKALSNASLTCGAYPLLPVHV